MPIQVTKDKKINTCLDCEYIKEYHGCFNSRAHIGFFACNDGKRMVNPTDKACEHFKCECCGTSRLGKGEHFNNG